MGGQEGSGFRSGVRKPEGVVALGSPMVRSPVVRGPVVPWSLSRRANQSGWKARLRIQLCKSGANLSNFGAAGRFSRTGYNGGLFVLGNQALLLELC